MKEEMYKILVIEDERTNRQIVADILKEDYKLVMAADAAQGVARAEKHMPDMILLDIVMPDESGYDVLKKLKSKNETKDIPVIFLTALSNEDEEEKGLGLGAVDYITKPFHPAIMKARIKIHMEITRQRKLLECLSSIDGLTNIVNRRVFDETLDKEWRRNWRSCTSMAVAMIDVDFFKPYNDNYGHGAGDKVLVKVAMAIQNQMKRAGDCCARYGGEEFALVLPNSSAQSAHTVAEACRQAIYDLDITHDFSAASGRLTVSIGVAYCVPDDKFTAEQLLENADDALYRAKKSGRNNVVGVPYEVISRVASSV